MKSRSEREKSYIFSHSIIARILSHKKKKDCGPRTTYVLESAKKDYDGAQMKAGWRNLEVEADSQAVGNLEDFNDVDVGDFVFCAFPAWEKSACSLCRHYA